MAAAPALSVVMPVHNAAPWLDESVASILGQDDGDFEFVIFDDGSTDGSRERLREWAARDRRIRLLESDRCLGPVGSSNRVVVEARGALIARMDADDVALPSRLGRQRALFDAHPQAVLVGSLTEMIDARGRRVRGADYPRLLRASRFAPFSHPTVMFRRAAFERAGGYRDEAALWEDVDLYLRLAREGQVLTIAEPLVRVRAWRGNVRSARSTKALMEAMIRMHSQVEGDDVDPRTARRNAWVASGSVAVWAGHPPRVLPAMWRDAPARSLKALVWAAWAELSPRSLRFALTSLLALRSRWARRMLGAARVFEWRPGETPRPAAER